MGAERARCVLLLETDWQDMVIRYKALCLAYGGTREACQIQEE